MKIGIISRFRMHDSVNYGNKLQAYALNRYINKKYNEHEAYSLYMKDDDEKGIVTCKDIVHVVKCKLKYCGIIKNIINIFRKKINLCVEVETRAKLMDDFCRKNIKMCEKPVNWFALQKSTYDMFIVGSDIVWGQWEGEVSRIRFLDFKNKKDFKKISYAASFGKDWIPEENQSKVKELLSDFDLISVRESSSVGMLQEIGITNAVHVLDPTLLLTRTEWSEIEKKPNINENKYIFTYILSEVKEYREAITEFAEKNNIKIITIPYVLGKSNDVDKNFGDIQLVDCSISEWIWLIHHAEYVITDSFHGTIFSTIFNKKFLVLKRQMGDINNRMLDYLSTINETDKFVDLREVEVSSLVWNYHSINSILDKKRKISEEFLDKVLDMGMKNS